MTIRLNKKYLWRRGLFIDPKTRLYIRCRECGKSWLVNLDLIATPPKGWTKCPNKCNKRTLIERCEGLI